MKTIQRQRQSVHARLPALLYAPRQNKDTPFHNIDASGQDSRLTEPTQIACACRLPVGTDCYLHMYKTLLERQRWENSQLKFRNTEFRPANGIGGDLLAGLHVLYLGHYCG